VPLLAIQRSRVAARILGWGCLGVDLIGIVYSDIGTRHSSSIWRSCGMMSCRGGVLQGRVVDQVSLVCLGILLSLARFQRRMLVGSGVETASQSG
jgi:hypothetical protein